MRRLLRPFLHCALILLLAAGTPALHAEGTAPAATGTTPAKAAIEPVAPGEIPLRANTDERFVQEVMAHARQKDPGATLEPRLEELAAGTAKLAERFKKDELFSLAAIRLESLERHWNFYDRQLDQWRRSLQRATGMYSEDAAELARLRAVWEATRAATEASGVASALRDRIDAVLAEIALAEQAISGPLDHQFKLNRRANLLQAGVDSGKRGVAAAIAHYDQRLSMTDAPTLVQAWQDPRISRDATRAALTGLTIENDFLKEYFSANQGRLRAHALFAAIMLPLLLWLSWRSRKLVSNDPELQSSAKVLLRPVSSWLVLVLVGTLFFEPDAPLLLHQAVLLAALIPVLRLLPKRVFDVLGPWPYIGTGLYVLNGLGIVLVPSPLLHRVHLLAVTALTFVALVWLLLRTRRRMSPDAGRPPATVMVLRGLGWLAAAGLVVSVMANLYGNVSLAEMLSGATLDSIYLGLVLYAGAGVLSAMVKLLLARKTMSRFHIVTRHAGPLLNAIARLIGLAALATWIVAALNEFRVFRPIADWARRVLTYPVGLGKISITLGSVLLFLFSVWVAIWLARTIRVVLQDEVLPKMALPRGVGNSISTLTYYGMVTIGLMVALAAAGFEISQFAIVFGALGVGIGFGLQNVVNNFVSGLILMFERPIQPGDVIEVSGTSGKVRDIGMRATILTTFEGADVVVPNGMLLAEKLVNWTLSDMNRRLDVNVSVAYGSDPRRVLELLMEVATATAGVAAQPEPAVIFVGFGANSLDFSIRAWTNDFNDWVAIRSSMAVRVYEGLKAAGIEIPFPQHDLHLRSISPEARAELAGLRGRPPTVEDELRG